VLEIIDWYCLKGRKIWPKLRILRKGYSISKDLTSVFYIQMGVMHEVIFLGSLNFQNMKEPQRIAQLLKTGRKRDLNQNIQASM